MHATRRRRWQQSAAGEMVAEFLGTMIIILFGNGLWRWSSPAQPVWPRPEAVRGQRRLAAAHSGRSWTNSSAPPCW
jgi:hypothetical protein